jgi:WD40 repeat protein
MEEGEARQALQGAGPPEEQALAQQQQEDGGGDPHQEGQQLEVTDQVVNQQAPVIEGVLEKADHQQESPREKEGAVEAEIDAGIQAEGQSTEGGEVQAQYESEARMMEATAELSTGEGEVLLGDVSGEARAAISYTRDQFARCLGPGELSRDLVAPHHVFGIDTSRLENLKCVEPGIFMHTSGNSLSVLSLDTAIDYKRRIKRRESLFGLDGGGIGCFTLHPSGKLVAVGERGDSPNIYIYSYPALTLVNVLKEGTERGYSCLAFNAAGDKLASVGQSPDFLLTIWEWRDEKVTLHTKAFGQEVFRVAFSPYDEGRLVTSGTGHIRFWRMASTFTGLKLQGDIGKFGKVELSDISAFDILPDGKVLSGSESGHLLLWEGNFIKCRFVLAGEGGDKGCHDGEVTVLRRDGDAFMTAGLDGWIRWWSLVVIDGAEVDTDHSMDFEISPIREMHAGMGVAIQCLERGGERGSSSDYFLITDANGSLRQLAVNNLPSEGAYSAKMEAQAVFEFHSGQVNDLDTCPKEHLAASAGADGSIRLWDYVHKNMLEMERFSAAVTCLQWMRESVDPTGRTIAAGFADGVLRFLVRGGKTLQCTAVAKPHSCAIVDLSISPSGQRIATAGKDGTIFLFNIGSGAGSITPAGFIDKQALGIPSGLSWRADSLSLMCTFDGGAVCEASLAGGALDGANTKNSYDITALVPCQEFYLQVKETVLQKHGSAADLDASDEQCEQLTPGDASPDETSSSPSDSPPNATAPSIRTTQGTAPALQSVYLPEEKHFLVSYGGWAAGQIYECSWDAVEPLASYAMGSEGTVRPSVLHMKTALGGKLLLSGSDDGCVTVRPLERCKGAAAFARVLLHIGHMSVKTCAAVSYDGDWLVTAGGDGLVSSCRIRVHDLLEAAAELAPTVPVQPLLPAALASPVPSAMERKKLANDGAATTETKSGAVPSFWLRSHDGEEGDPAVTDLSKYNFKTGEHLPEPSMYAAVEHEVEDAVVASGYSIEEEKLKREEGNRLREASDRKAAVRAVVASMREEYERLVTENAQLPADVRLSPESMRPDAHLLEFIELNRKELTEEVRMLFCPTCMNCASSGRPNGPLS